MKTRYVEVKLQDEAKRIGCGRRVVQIKQSSKRWVTLIVPTTGVRQRILAVHLPRILIGDVKVRRKFRKSYSEVR